MMPINENFSIADGFTDLNQPGVEPNEHYGPNPEAIDLPQKNLISPFDRSNTRNRYLYSFSGADCRAYTWFPTNPSDIQLLPTMHTISLSVHEAKGSVRRLGHRGISGHTRAIRTIAGSMILTVINDHPLASLMRQNSRASQEPLGWSLDKELIGSGTLQNELALDSLLPTLLPPFDLALYYVSENANVLVSRTAHEPRKPDFSEIPRGSQRRDAKRAYKGARSEANMLQERPEAAALLVKGIEFQDDGFVTSVNDMVSEVTLTFTAFDYKPLADINRETLESQADYSYVKQSLELQRRLLGE